MLYVLEVAEKNSGGSVGPSVELCENRILSAGNINSRCKTTTAMTNIVPIREHAQ
jgi:hypothetical protein